MRIVFGIFLTLTLAVCGDYYSIKEYQKLHPEQKALMQQFEKEVQAQAVPIKIAHKRVKIAMLYPGQQVTDYWRRSQKSFEKRLQELEISYEIKDYFVDENDVATIKQTMLELLNYESDYLIFTLNIQAHKKLVSQLIHKQKPKVILQNITTPLKSWGQIQPFMYVGFDHIKGTQLLAEFLKEKLPKGAKYMMLYHNEGYVSKMRGDSFIKMTQGYFALQKSVYTYVDREKAKQAVQNYEDLDKLDFIYNCSTDIAVGASDALQDKDMQKEIFLNGWGGGSLELEMVQKGTLDFTVMRMNDDNGVAMAEAIKRELQQKEVPLIYSGKFQIVHSKTPKEKIERLKKRAFRYSQ